MKTIRKLLFLFTIVVLTPIFVVLLIIKSYKHKKITAFELKEKDKIDDDELDYYEIERDVIVRWCDICDMDTEYSDDTPYGTCQCS
jgi:hypothetical protein